MHISTGVTKGRSHGDSTYPWQVHGNLHWHHWATMDPKILGVWAPLLVPPSGDGPKGGGFVDTSTDVTAGSHLGCAQAPRRRWGH